MIQTSINHCTGCSACIEICPKQCITMKPDVLDAIYPEVNEDECIDCGLCEKTCPNNRALEFHHPKKVWAAWSKNEEIRHTSASGGVACELYHHWIRLGGVATGVIYDREEGCHFVLIEKDEDIKPTQNSKYTFSNTYGIYKVVKEKLNAGIPVLFIGVPCQVAGLYGFLKKGYENLTTIDIICHGMPPEEYLKQHVERIEKRKHEHTSELYFRDPKYFTYTFTFTLKGESGKEFYKKKVLTMDNYQLGYHRALIYRENCYHCRYARKERISDLTIGDFMGLGKSTLFEYEKRNVSCVLQNTLRGELLINAVKESIVFIERPELEAFEYEKQLKQPSIKHQQRDTFVRIYSKTKNFDKASSKSLRFEKFKSIIARINMKIKNR